MKEKIALSKLVDVGNDVSVKSFKPNYMYFMEDGVQIYFDGANIQPLKMCYPGTGSEDGEGVVVISAAMAIKVKQAIVTLMDVCANRLENKFVPR